MLLRVRNERLDRFLSLFKTIYKPFLLISVWSPLTICRPTVIFTTASNVQIVLISTDSDSETVYIRDRFLWYTSESRFLGIRSRFVRLQIHIVKLDVSSRWSSSLYCSMRDSDQLTIEMTYPSVFKLRYNIGRPNLA